MSVFAQDYYVWVDANGVTNYAQKKPLGVESRLITGSQRVGAGDQIVDTRRGSRPGAQAFDNANLQAEQAAKQSETTSQTGSTDQEVDPDKIIAEDRAIIAAKIAEQKSANCEIGKKQLTTLEMFRRIRIKDENGAERVLNEDEKATRIATARKTIRENCTN
jgi:hypothetical protein